MTTRSERIKLLIEQSGLSYQELEKKTGIKKSSLQRYASGVTIKIPLDVIEKLSKAFNVSQEYLMGWSDDKNITAEEKRPAEDGEPLTETMIIYHRDGKTVKREFTKEQMDMLVKMIEAIPEKPKNI